MGLSQVQTLHPSLFQGLKMAEQPLKIIKTMGQCQSKVATSRCGPPGHCLD
ncbi:MAG: hypothetical protein RLZZ519_2527 [Bacteroidota bacterium]|jgi:hypothetical protein